MKRVCVRSFISVDTVLRGNHARFNSNKSLIMRIGEWFGKGIVLLWLAFGLIFLFVLPRNPRPGEPHPSIPLLAVSLGCVAFYTLTRANSRFRLKRTLALKSAKDLWVEWTFTPDRVCVRDALSQSEFRWELITLVIESELGFLFKINTSSGYWIESSAFTSEDEVRQIASWAKARVTRYQRRQPILIDANQAKFPSLDEI